MSVLQESLVFLLAAVISVPLSRRLGFGSVLGYLAAGIMIGPFGLSFINDVEHILHFAELGVVFLLFVVGLELKPSRLWIMRHMVFGLGALQVALSAIAITIVAWLFGLETQAAIVLGLILALSSTAFVLQMLAEKKQLATTHGRAAFSVLLFQDLAAIPLIAIMPMLGARAGLDAGLDLTSVLLMVGTIVGLVVGGRFLLRPVLRIAARSEIPEIFTATALLVVIGSALLVQVAGMSMVLGAFLAGILLADSEYRHQLEADIAPFKGLLLGLFFIAVGMSINMSLLMSIPGRIVLIVVLLMLTKALVLFPLGRRFGMCNSSAALKLAAILSQGGEFAFVLFTIAKSESVLPDPLIDEMTLAAAVSMALPPLIYWLAERSPKESDTAESRDFDVPDEEDQDVIIAGNGRVGQIVARVLSAAGKPFTALELDTRQVDLLRSYGATVYYGDASRLDLLRAAGADKAKIFVLAIADLETSVHVAEVVSKHFPKLTIVARARNRRHAHVLMDVGVKIIIRETLHSSLAMTEQILTLLGDSEESAKQAVQQFLDYDNKLLAEQHAVHDSEEKLIQTTKDRNEELERLLRDDLEH